MRARSNVLDGGERCRRDQQGDDTESAFRQRQRSTPMLPAGGDPRGAWKFDLALLLPTTDQGGARNPKRSFGGSEGSAGRWAASWRLAKESGLPGILPRRAPPDCTAL